MAACELEHRVEPVGSVIVARLRGVPTAEMLRECEQRVLVLARDTRHVRVLYDVPGA